MQPHTRLNTKLPVEILNIKLKCRAGPIYATNGYLTLNCWEIITDNRNMRGKLGIYKSSHVQWDNGNPLEALN